MGSEICRRVQSSQATKVTNMKVFACLVLLVSTSVAFPQAKSGCGTNERGVARKPGDNWQEQCNRCRCLESGVPGCTKKFCGSIPGLFEPASKTCKDSDGNIREEGALWEENGSGEVCTCGKGVVLCTSLQPVTDNRKTKGTEDVGVRFPELVQRKQLASMQMVTHVMTETVGRRIVTP